MDSKETTSIGHIYNQEESPKLLQFFRGPDFEERPACILVFDLLAFPTLSIPNTLPLPFLLH
jgi:hypothetical protein